MARIMLLFSESLHLDRPLGLSGAAPTHRYHRPVRSRVEVSA